MPGCCLVAAILFFGPRVALFFAWAFSSWYTAFDSSLVAILGWLFAPWTSMAWMFTFFHNGGDIGRGYVVLLVLGGLTDIGAFGGGSAARRKRDKDD